jgi:hypothetical protein
MKPLSTSRQTRRLKRARPKTKSLAQLEASMRLPAKIGGAHPGQLGSWRGGNKLYDMLGKEDARTVLALIGEAKKRLDPIGGAL